jgi:NadR type nicotinamide-nucleotide adenylyltransferase
LNYCIFKSEKIIDLNEIKDKLLNSFDKKLIRIAITGPESTGKSTLAKQLADYYHTMWVPEYARKYLDQLNRPYDEKDLVKIATGQIQAEDEAELSANKFLFCDTELTVIKIWSLHKFGKADPFIISEDRKRSYDFYLLLDIDLPWEYDPQREHPEKRKYFFDWFEEELKAKGVDYKIIKGNQEKRFQNARKLLDPFIIRRNY